MLRLRSTPCRLLKTKLQNVTDPHVDIIPVRKWPKTEEKNTFQRGSIFFVCKLFDISQLWALPPPPPPPPPSSSWSPPSPHPPNTPPPLPLNIRQDPSFLKERLVDKGHEEKMQLKHNSQKSIIFWRPSLAFLRSRSSYSEEEDNKGRREEKWKKDGEVSRRPDGRRGRGSFHGTAFVGPGQRVYTRQVIFWQSPLLELQEIKRSWQGNNRLWMVRFYIMV